LRSNPSHLRELHLTRNNVGDSGVEILSDLKDDERYKLQTLTIRCSEITGESGKALSSVLNSETSSLRELHLTVTTLDLSGIKLRVSGVKRLSALLENPECKVKDL
ncbi:ribonuclease inhibitor-like isoform X3, partial [Silurus asotus]